MEVFFCDIHLLDSSKRDCFLHYVEDPSDKVKINIEVWQGKNLATIKSAISAMKKDKTLRSQMETALGAATCKYGQNITGKRDTVID